MMHIAPWGACAQSERVAESVLSAVQERVSGARRGVATIDTHHRRTVEDPAT